MGGSKERCKNFQIINKITIYVVVGVGKKQYINIIRPIAPIEF